MLGTKTRDCLICRVISWLRAVEHPPVSTLKKCVWGRGGGRPFHHSPTSKIFPPFRQQPARMINLALRSAEPGSAKSIWGENFSEKDLSFLPPPFRFTSDFTAWKYFGGWQLFLQHPKRDIPQGERGKPLDILHVPTLSHAPRSGKRSKVG